jgi:hypothetical protein
MNFSAAGKAKLVGRSSFTILSAQTKNVISRMAMSSIAAAGRQAI